MSQTNDICSSLHQPEWFMKLLEHQHFKKLLVLEKPNKSVEVEASLARIGGYGSLNRRPKVDYEYVGNQSVERILPDIAILNSLQFRPKQSKVQQKGPSRKEKKSVRNHKKQAQPQQQQ